MKKFTENKFINKETLISSTILSIDRQIIALVQVMKKNLSKQELFQCSYPIFSKSC